MRGLKPPIQPSHPALHPHDRPDTSREVTGQCGGGRRALPIHDVTQPQLLNRGKCLLQGDAFIAGVFGFGGVAAAATDIARLLFVVFLVLFVIALVAGRRITSTPL